MIRPISWHILVILFLPFLLSTNAQDFNKDFIQQQNNLLNNYNETNNPQFIVDISNLVKKKTLRNNIIQAEAALDSFVYNRSAKRYKNSFLYDSQLRKTEAKIQKWDTLGSYWNNLIKENYTYNGNDLTIIISSDWNDSSSAWVNFSKTEFTFNSTNKLITETNFRWNNISSVWVKYDLNTYTYDANGFPNKLIYSIWDEASASWKNIIQTEYLFDLNGNMLVFRNSHWNETSSVWDASMMVSATFDSMNNLLTNLTQHWNQPSASWVNATKQTNTYNASYQLTNELFESWDTGVSDWKFHWRTARMYYLGGKEATYEKENWQPDSLSWIMVFSKTQYFDSNDSLSIVLVKNFDNVAHTIVNDYKEIYNYTNGLLTYKQRLDWYEGSSSFVDDFEYYYGYTPNGELNYFKSQHLVALSTWAPVNGSLNLHSNGETHFIIAKELWAYYGGLTNIDNSEILSVGEFSLEQNYPNPFNPSTVIEYQIPKEEFVTIKIYNTIGQLVNTLVSEQKKTGIYKLNFNASDLTSGVYFYNITVGKFTQTKKMLLLK